MLIHVINGPRLRGAERFAMELAESLSDRGVCQAVCCLRGLEDAPPVIPYCDIHVAPAVAFAPLRLAWLRSRLLQNPGSVVLCHGQGPQKETIAALLLSGAKKPFVATKQIGMLLDWVSEDDILRLSLNRWLMERTDLCICLGPRQTSEVHEVLRVPMTKIVQIPNGRRAPPNLPGDIVRDRREVLVVGALTAEKNPELALDIFCDLQGNLPDCTLTFAGDGPLRGTLEEKARRLVPAGSVRFLGHVKDIWPLYTRAGVVLLCSRTEGVPGTVIEATIAGAPTVAWNVGDVAEVLLDGRNGRLTRYGDPQALGTALQELIGNAGQWRQMCWRTRCVADSMSFDAIADSYVRALPLGDKTRVARLNNETMT